MMIVPLDICLSIRAVSYLRKFCHWSDTASERWTWFPHASTPSVSDEHGFHIPVVGIVHFQFFLVLQVSLSFFVGVEGDVRDTGVHFAVLVHLEVHGLRIKLKTITYHTRFKINLETRKLYFSFSCYGETYKAKKMNMSGSCHPTDPRLKAQ